VEEEDRGRVTLSWSHPGVAFAAGAATLVGGIVAGKIVIDAVQGRLPEPEGPSVMDESVRFVGSMLGLSLALLQLPRAYDAAQAIIQQQGGV
jgi:hypothetical protein